MDDNDNIVDNMCVVFENKITVLYGTVCVRCSHIDTGDITDDGSVATIWEVCVGMSPVMPVSHNYQDVTDSRPRHTYQQ